MSATDVRWGKIGIVLCGGGYKGLRQALQLVVFMKWLEEQGLELSHITGGSVGAYNAIALAENPSYEGAKKLWSVWEEVLELGDRFYKKHPILEEKLRRFIPHSPFHKHSSWKEFRDDCRNQTRSLANFVGFIGRVFWTGAYFLFKEELPASSGKIGDIIDHFFGVDARAFFDPSPLIAIVRRRIDFQKVVHSTAELSITAERFGDARSVIFSNRDYGMDSDRMFRCVLASPALYPYFEMIEIDSVEYMDGDIGNPLPIDIAFNSGCDTVFTFLNTSARLKHTRGGLLVDMLQSSEVQNHKMVADGIIKYQKIAKEKEKNLFIFRPKFVHKDLLVLSVSKDAVAFHKEHDPLEIEKYLSEIEKYNLRYLPDTEDYRANPQTYQNLDGDVHAYLRNL